MHPQAFSSQIYGILEVRPAALPVAGYKLVDHDYLILVSAFAKFVSAWRRLSLSRWLGRWGDFLGDFLCP